MNKNQIVMASIGGAALVIALVLGWLAWSAWSERGEKMDDLDTMKSRVAKMSGDKISPEQASITAIEENRKKLSAWRSESVGSASRGDFAGDPAMTSEALKQVIVGAAREMSELTGGAVGGKLVKEGFGFGFPGIVTGGDMPDRTKLGALQCQWHDVKLFVETLAACGAVELLDVGVVPEKEPEAKPVQKPGQKNRKAKNKEPEKPLATSRAYTLKFLARPAAVVKTLNAFAECERFVVVDKVSYVRAEDALATAVGGREKAEAAKHTGGRRGRRGRQVEAEQQESEEDVKKKGLVVDPATDTPFTVTMDISVYDFGTKTAEGAEANEEKEVAE